MAPTKTRILRRINEYRRIGRARFLEKYANNRASKEYFLDIEGKLYDAKAVWASAHEPPILPRDTNSITARKHLIGLGFAIVSNQEASEFEEGERSSEERVYFRRNAALVREAKRVHGTTCSVCRFNFEATYGEIGQGYIECHHLDPIAMNGKRISTVNDVAVVCANCHRMAHRRSPPYSVRELRRKIKPG